MCLLPALLLLLLSLTVAAVAAAVAVAVAILLLLLFCCCCFSDAVAVIAVVAAIAVTWYAVAVCSGVASDTSEVVDAAAIFAFAIQWPTWLAKPVTAVVAVNKCCIAVVAAIAATWYAVTVC